MDAKRKGKEMAGRKYRDIPYKRPAKGNKVPAFIVSEYEEHDVLIYSHGKFDIWCVYHGTPASAEKIDAETKQAYPLLLDYVKVDNNNSMLMSKGTFCEYNAIKYDFKAPEDVDYLGAMRELANKYNKDRAWGSFMELYETIPQVLGIGIKREMTAAAMKVAQDYANEGTLRLTLDCLLCAMISENNRTTPYVAVLGKKIKALGVYQAIYEQDMSLRDVANFSKGKKWRLLDEECKKRGINTPNLRR